MSDEITITIDGKPIKTTEGRNLVKVALENGIFIPSLCYYEHIDPPLADLSCLYLQGPWQTRASVYAKRQGRHGSHD